MTSTSASSSSSSASAAAAAVVDAFLIHRGALGASQQTRYRRRFQSVGAAKSS